MHNQIIHADGFSVAALSTRAHRTMKMHHLILGLLFLLTLAGNIHAASFDCAKATSGVEKIICGDDELSKLDESLNEAYLEALERTDIKKRTIESQRQWLKKVRNACKDADCIKKAYETRLKELGSLSYRSSDDEKMVWRSTIHRSIGVVEFKYEGEENGISVRTLRNNKQLQNIPASLDENGWIEFHDLNGDGYQDVVTDAPDYHGGSPISYGRVWIFHPKDKTFVEADDISSRGFIEKAKERGCLILTYRRSWTKSPFYIGEYWCFDEPSGKWKHKKDLSDHFPR